MIHLIDFQTVRPNRITEKNKDNNPKYHLDNGRFVLANSFNSTHKEWVDEIIMNEKFYKGDQWQFEEDIDAFLNDESGSPKNRIKIVKNVIRPMIEQYRGNAINLIISPIVECISPSVVTRRDIELGKKMFMYDLAEEMPHFAEHIRRRYGIGSTREETISMFNNTYVDMMAETMTMFVKHVGKINKLQDKQLKAAENLAFSGLCGMYGYESGGKMKWDVIDSKRFFWDRSARESDLSDADGMGIYEEMLPTTIYEMFSDTLSQSDKEAIEEFTRSIQNNPYTNNSNTGSIGTTHVPVFKVYWRDTDMYKLGYVRNEFGYEELVKIDYVYPGETEPRWTEKDLIQPPKTKRSERLFKGKLYRTASLDSIRYVYFIPREVLSFYRQDKDNTTDVVLDYGKYVFQDSSFEDPANVSFPFKIATWAYIDGDVISPTKDAIDPQRMVNRVMSVFESQINQSGGSNITYDKDALDADYDEYDLLNDVNNGRPIGLHTRGRGVPNSIGVYDATPKSGTYALMNIVTGLEGAIATTTGVNEALRGESSGSDQLVGVMNQMIQRGSLMQEPFYHALSNLFMQVYEYTANVGKNIYIDNEMEMAVMVGDDGYKLLKLSSDLKTESFRLFVRKDHTDANLKAFADQQLVQLMQLGLIDDKIFSGLYGRSTPTEVGKYLRQFAREKREAERIALNNQKQQQDEQLQAAQQEQMIKDEQTDIMMNKQLEGDLLKKQIEGENKVNEVIAKGLMNQNLQQ